MTNNLFSFLLLTLFSIAMSSNSAVVKNSEEQDFILHRNKIYVKVLVNEKPYSFMVDIGATGIGRIHKNVAKELGLDSVGQTTNFDGINTKIEPLVRVKSLKFGTIEARNVDIMSKPYYYLSTDVPIDGILGAGFFEDYLLDIDYPSSKIRWSKGQLKKSDSEVLPYDQYFYVPGEIAGEEYKFMFDTGSGGGIEIPQNIVEKYAYQDTKVSRNIKRANTIYKVQEAMIREQLKISFIKRDSFLVTYSDVIDKINVGGEFLKAYRLLIDQKCKCIKIM